MHVHVRILWIFFLLEWEKISQSNFIYRYIVEKIYGHKIILYKIPWVLRWFTSIIWFFILKALDMNVCIKIQAKTNPAINHIPCHDANIGNLARANIFSAFQIMNKLSWIWHLSCKCTIHAAHIRFKVQIHQCVFVKYYI